MAKIHRPSAARVRRSGPRYSPKAARNVERAMHEMKRGELRSGKSGARVTNPKQAVAIGLAEAREAGAKLPPSKGRSKPARSR